jgi:hypothetical protein
MGWNGSGTYTREQDWAAEATAGNPISSTKFDIENDSFAAGINACIAKNGENAATGDLPMGGNKHTGVADGTASNHYAAVGQVQDGSLIWGGTSGGTANAQTITLSPAITAYAAGQQFAFLAGNTNTGACTLNVNGLGVKDVFANNTACSGGEITSGLTYSVIYDGTQFNLIGPSVLPASSAHRDANLSMNYGGPTVITLNKDLYDPDNLHSTVTNTERIVLGRVGLWTIVGTLTMDNTSAPNYSNLYIYQNGVEVAREEFIGNYVTISQMVYASSATDYVDLRLFNNTVGSVNVNPVRLSAGFLR